MVFGSADGEGRKETSSSSSSSSLDLSCEFLAGSECVCLCGGFNRQLEGGRGGGRSWRPQQTLKTHPAFKNGGEAWEIMVRCLDGAACCISYMYVLSFSFPWLKCVLNYLAMRRASEGLAIWRWAYRPPNICVCTATLADYPTRKS